MSASQGVEGPVSRPAARTMLAYAGILVVYFIANVDVAIVATSLPVIAGELGGVELFGWVGAAYLLALSATSPFYAKFGDMVGRRPVIFTALGIFLLGSLACGFAWSMESLIAARVLQGLGAGGLTVSAYATIGDLFSGRERAKYQSYVATVFTLATLGGPLLGGVLTDYVGWRWIFFVNLPLGVVVLVLLTIAMPRTAMPKQHKMDYAGGILLAVGITALIVWSDYALGPSPALVWIVAFLIVGIGALAAFIAVERRAAEPIIPLRLFSNRTITLLTVANLIAGSVSLGLLFHNAFYLQMIGRLSSTELGLLQMAAPLGQMITATIAGRLIARTGRFKIFLVIGMALGMANMIAYSFTGPLTPIWVLVALSVTGGFVIGCWLQVSIVAVQTVAPKADMGVATGLITQTRAMGGSIGLAVNGAIAGFGLAMVAASVPPAVAMLVPGGLAALDPLAIAAMPPDVATSVLGHFATGFHYMYLYAAAGYLVSLVLILMLPDIEIEKHA